MSDEPADGPTLSDVLKMAGLAETGGHAKRLIQAGEVRVNGRVETRRKHRLSEGDEIDVHGEGFVIELAEDDSGTADEATDDAADDAAADDPPST